jgi:O-glycosyl hydrolase
VPHFKEEVFMRHRPPKRLISGFAVLLTIATLFTMNLGNTSISHAAAYTVTITPSQQYQTIQGWGSSMAWWANIAGGWADSKRTALADALFSPTTGIGLNVLRYNFGADGPGNVCEKQMQPGGNVPSFEPTQGNYVWTNDANQLWMAQAAHALGADVFEGFPNSAPAWMLDNSCTAGGPGGIENLNPAHYTDFANYIATIAQHFHDSFGITLQTVAPFNEPNQNWWSTNGNQEGMKVSPADQSTIIPLVAAALQQNGASAYTQISSPDDTSLSSSINDYNAYSATAKADIAQWNTHTYVGTDAQRQSAYTNIGQTDHKRLWMSEWNDGSKGNQGSEINAALLLSSHILDDEHNLHPSAWVIWQALNQAGESINGDQGLAYQDANGNVSYPTRYYAMGNYSKYVREGSVMLGDSDANSLTTYNASAQTLTIVTTNSTTSSEPVSYDLSAFAGVGATATPHQTSASENLVQLSDIAIANNAFSTTLPAQSITTFVIPNVSISTTAATYDTIVNRNSGQVMDVTGASTSAGADVIQAASTGTASQQWSLVPLSGGYYTVVNRNSGLVLDVAGASTSTKADIIQAVSTGATSQQWSLTTVGAGAHYLVTNRNSGLVLDVSGASTVAGANVIQYTSHGSSNQQWSLAPA